MWVLIFFRDPLLCFLSLVLVPQLSLEPCRATGILSVRGVITLLILNPQPCVFSDHPPHPKLYLDYTGSKLKPLAQVHTASEWLSVQTKVIEIK